MTLQPTAHGRSRPCYLPALSCPVTLSSSQFRPTNPPPLLTASRYHRCTCRPAAATLWNSILPPPPRLAKIPSLHHPSCSVSGSCPRESPFPLVSPQRGQASLCLRMANNSLVCPRRKGEQSPRGACLCKTFAGLPDLLSSVPGAPKDWSLCHRKKLRHGHGAAPSHVCRSA